MISTIENITLIIIIIIITNKKICFYAHLSVVNRWPVFLVNHIFKTNLYCETLFITVRKFHLLSGKINNNA